jgi:hypothetical protein
MVPQPQRVAAWADILNLLLGVLLFLAPWLFAFVSDLASENAWVSGGLISAVATGAIIASDAREERLNLLLGLWVALCPWLLGLEAERHIHVLVGLLVTTIAALEIGWASRHRRAAAGY